MEESNLFTCALCHVTFPKGRPDEEAKNEADFLFPPPQDTLVLLCDPCFMKVIKRDIPRLKRYEEFINKEK